MECTNKLAALNVLDVQPLKYEEYEGTLFSYFNIVKEYLIWNIFCSMLCIVYWHRREHGDSWWVHWGGDEDGHLVETANMWSDSGCLWVKLSRIIQPTDSILDVLSATCSHKAYTWIIGAVWRTVTGIKKTILLWNNFPKWNMFVQMQIALWLAVTRFKSICRFNA